MVFLQSTLSRFHNENAWFLPEIFNEMKIENKQPEIQNVYNIVAKSISMKQLFSGIIFCTNV